MSETLAVGLIQSPAYLKGAQARLAWLQQMLAEHADKPWDIIILPELYQSGYHIGDRIPEWAEPSDGTFAQAIGRLAQQYRTAILYGYAERQGEGLYNSAQCIDKHGKVIGHHRKLVLPPGFESSHFAAGGSCAPFRLGNFKIGMLICYDAEFPENMRYIALQGVDLVAVPTALGAEWSVVSQKVMPTRAFENGVYIGYANSAGHENGMDFLGGSCLVSPDGSDLARAGSAPECLYAMIEKSAIMKAQKRLPYHKDRQNLPWL